MRIRSIVQKVLVLGDIVKASLPILFSSSNDLNIRVRFSKVKVPRTASNFLGETDEYVKVGLTVFVFFDADSSEGDGSKSGEMLVEFILSSVALGVCKKESRSLKGCWHIKYRRPLLTTVLKRPGVWWCLLFLIML